VTLPNLLEGLAETGFVEGRNLTIKDSSSEGHPERFPERAAEAVKERVSLIAAVSGLPSIAAAKAQTTTIPIVFITPGDPVALGLVQSINHPGGNLTGIGGGGVLMVAKQLEVLNELVPGHGPLAMLLDPNTEAEALEKSAKTAGSALSRAILIAGAPTDRDFEPAFASISAQKAAGVVINDQPLFASHHKQIAGLAARFRIPAVYDPQDLATSGGLASYGASIYDIFHQAGVIAGKILAGANPAEFPVEEPDRIRLKLNLKTAQSLGLTVPVSLLARADEVIE
jgi:putative ABC transport system substrate-binding protein